MLEAVIRALRGAARGLRRSPVFTLVAVLSLAMGIGANAAIFALVDTLVLRPLPGVAEPDAVVELAGESFSYPAVRDLMDGTRSARLAGYATRWLALSGGETAERVEATVVTGDYFGVLGVRPRLGRTLRAADDAPDAPLVAVLSAGAWAERFGADPAVLGRDLELNGQRFTIVGVAPAGFHGARLGSRPVAWITVRGWARVKRGQYAALDMEGRGWSWLHVLGRLAPGADADAVAGDVAAVRRREAELYPRAVPEPRPVQVVPAAAAAAGLDGSRALGRFGLILMGAVALALLIACANVANLLLARASRRRHELAVRRALGAGRARVAAEAFAESLVLAALGAAAGVLVAAWGVNLLASATLPGDIAVEAGRAGLNARVVGFAAGLGVVTCVLFGLLPALRAASTQALGALGARASTEGPRGARTRGVLVGLQVALCLVLLAGGGLLVRSLGRAMHADLGFDADRLGVLEVDLGNSGYAPDRVRAYMRDVRERVLAAPGVEAAAWVGNAPLTQDVEEESFSLDAPTPPGSRDPSASEVDFVGPGYFATTGTRLLRGAGFAEAGPAQAVVSRAFVRRFAPRGDPLGRTLYMGPGVLRIVGVAEDVALHGPTARRDPLVYVYVPDATPGSVASLLVRTRGRPEAALPRLVPLAARVDASLPVRTESLGERLRVLLAPQRVAAALFGVFGVLTLVLAATGIYGVVAYATGRRTREFGIRVALGGRPATVAALVVRQGARAVLVGAALGLGGAWVAGRALRSLLYDVAPADPLALGLATLLLAGAALLALLVPALRAARVDPAEALREE